MLNEFKIKKARIVKFLDDNEYDGIIYATNENFSWLSCGHYAFVDKFTGYAVAKFFVTRDKQYVICNSSEMFRIPEEELNELPFEVLSYYWHDNEERVLAPYIKGLKIATDYDCVYGDNKKEELQELRFILTQEEMDRYREIGQGAAETIENCCRKVQIGQTEIEIAAVLAKELMAKGFQVPVNLVGADERLKRYRHVLPTSNRVEKRFMIATCAQKYGLTISISRIVSFGEIDVDTQKRLEAVAEIDAVYINSTKAGVRVGDIVKAGYDMYKQTGYEKDFHYHHQGGAIGYLTRDYCANEECENMVLNNQAFAWNPTIAKVKSEDTYIIHNDEQEILSNTDSWPMIDVIINGANYKRPGILVREVY